MATALERKIKKASPEALQRALLEVVSECNHLYNYYGPDVGRSYDSSPSAVVNTVTMIKQTIKDVLNDHRP